ncbi:MAG: PEGA domain-containing protein [Planctomycetota bacterium]
MSIREDETIEVLSPFQRTSRLLGRLVLVLLALVIVAAGAVALSADLRHWLFGVGGRPVQITIASSPAGADVFVDGEHLGKSPAEATVARGQHEVRIVLEDYEPWRGTIDTAQLTRLSPTLEPLKLATLIVEAKPDRANVLLDGDFRGVTPLTLHHVEAGAHILRISREPMYKAVIEHIELRAGETRRIHVELESGLRARYEGLVEEHPEELSNYTDLIHLHVVHGRPDEAVAVITQALQVLERASPPSDQLSRFYNELSAVYRGRAGALDDAIRQKLLDAIIVLFEKLAVAHPDDPEHYERLVSLLGQTGKWDAIMEVCDRTAKQIDEPGVVHLHVAKMYLGWEEAKCAIMLLQQAAKHRPKDFDVRYRLGYAYRQAGRLDEALAEYRAAEKLKEDASHYYTGLLYYEMARVLAAKDDVDGAIASYEKALEVKVSAYYSSKWRYRYAALLLREDRQDEAVKQYQTIVRQNPDSSIGRAARKALRRLKAGDKNDK